jgi:hypothetical protein
LRASFTTAMARVHSLYRDILLVTVQNARSPVVMIFKVEKPIIKIHYKRLVSICARTSFQRITMLWKLTPWTRHQNVGPSKHYWKRDMGMYITKGKRSCDLLAGYQITPSKFSTLLKTSR